MLSIVKLQREERTEKDLDFLAECIVDRDLGIDFFIQLGLNEETLLEVVNCLSYVEMREGETVMEYGDVGNNFYLILQGEV